MARKKVLLEWIDNQYSRRVSLKKRRESLLKKVHELSTLCGVLACAVIVSPGEEQVMHWPETIEGVKEVTDKFFALSELQQVRKSTTQESYLRNKVSKMQEKVTKKDKRAQEDKMNGVIHQLLSEGRNIESLSMQESNGVRWLLAERKKAIARKIYLFNNNLLGNGVEAPEAGPNAAGDVECSDNESDADDEVEGGDNGGFDGEWGGLVTQGDLVDQWLRGTDQNGGINNIESSYWNIGSSSNGGNSHVSNNGANGGGYDLMGQPQGQAKLTIGENDKGKAVWTMDGHHMINGGGDNNNTSGANIENCMRLSQWTNDVVWSGDGNIMGGNNIGDGNDVPFPHYTGIGGENGVWPPQWTVGGSSGGSGENGMWPPQWTVGGSSGGSGENGMGPPQWTIGGSSGSGGNGMGPPQWTIGGSSGGGGGENRIGMPQWTIGHGMGMPQWTNAGNSRGGVNNIGMPRGQNTNHINGDYNGIGTIQQINGGAGMGSPWWSIGGSITTDGINSVKIPQDHYINGSGTGNGMSQLIHGGGGNDMQFSQHYTTIGGENATTPWWTIGGSGGINHIGMPQSQDTNGGDNGIGMILQWINDGAENITGFSNHTIGDGNGNGGHYNMEVPSTDSNNGDAANMGTDHGSIANQIHGNGNNAGESDEIPNPAKD